MSDITVTLPDGSSRVVPAGTTPADIAAAISPGLARAALAAFVGDRMVDLSYPLDADARVRIVTSSSPEALALYRHSTAHLLAAAVTNLFPGTQCGIGPATEEGFFYDFVVERPFVPEDLERIEKKMKELAAQDLPFERQMWPRDEARQFFTAKHEPLKVPVDRREDRRPVRGLLLHDQGPRHVRRLLRRPARAEHGQAEGLQAAEHVERLLEGRRSQPADAARLRDGVLQRERAEGVPAPHRGSEEAGSPQARKELGLFTFHRWAPGAAFWLDKGTTLYNILANYMREVLFPAGYAELKTPLVYNKGLWETSGHWQHYRQNMFLIEARGTDGGQGDELPGPHAGLRQRSAQLPGLAAALSEQPPLHRNEASGVLSGLTRVRQFSQDDAH
jgi:threonyl-tRNA synthetase